MHLQHNIPAGDPIRSHTHARVGVASATPLRAVLLHALCLFGLGVGGIAAIEGDEAIG